MHYTFVTKPFSHWLANLDELNGWLYIDETAYQLNPDTVCHCVTIDENATQEETAAAEAELAERGWSVLIDRASVKRVAAELSMQKPSCNQHDVMDALNAYWLEGVTPLGEA